ncbi:hypothetical protein FQR65_LT10964 [Abscondita terminalis]|nr:hypothetical protein FQR65_LT10964 [Abscondita terminalis]
MSEFFQQCSDIIEKCKNKCAVCYWDEENVCKNLSYKEIWDVSATFTENLKEIITEDERTCIGLYMKKNHYIPSLILSLQHCNCAFIFLDPRAERINLEIIQNLNIKWIISHKENMDKFLPSRYTVVQNFENLIVWKTDLVTPKGLHYENIMFVICTSGTTGHSKTVKVSTNCIISNINALRNKFCLTDEDVIYFGTPLTFDPSIVELFLALTTGCTLVVPPSCRKSPFLNVNVLFPKNGVHKGVTVLQTVPSLFAKWTDADIKFLLQKSSCRILAFGGEKFPEYILSYPKFEDLKLFNLYGITEVSCWASVCEVDNGEITLGEPLPETVFEVRDTCGNKISEGEGELFIGSDSRICYVNDESDCTLVKPVFRATGDLVNLKDNKLFYVGRSNHIIKRFGRKINLLKIEQIVLEKSQVLNSCIWVERLQKLVLFVVVTDFDVATKGKITDKLRIKLIQVLPTEYIPDDIETVPYLPITSHGKIDTQTLEMFYYSSMKCNSNENVVDLLHLLWCKHLGFSRDDVVEHLDCNFFDLGGNSIGAIQCISEFSERVGADYSDAFSSMLFGKTLRDCSELIKDIKIKVNRKRKSEGWIEMESLNSIEMKVKWKHCLKACVDSSPVIINNERVAIGSFSHIFAILDCVSGDVLIQIGLPDAVESACCVSSCHKYVYTGCYDGNMYCIEATTGDIIWKYSTSDRIKCTPCLVEQHNSIIFGSYDKHLHSVDYNLGNSLWTTYLGGSITSKPLLHEDVFYVANILGKCFCISCSNGHVIWTRDVHNPIFGGACLISEYMCVTWIDVNGKLHGFSHDTGDKLWCFQAGGHIYSSIVNEKNCVIFGSSNGKLYCVDIHKNKAKLNYVSPLGSPILSTPTIFKHDGKSFCLCATNEGIVCITAFDDGTILGKISLPAEVFSSPTVFGNCLYVGCRDNNVYCIEFYSKENK